MSSRDLLAYKRAVWCREFGDLGEVAQATKDGSDPVAAICATLNGIAAVTVLQLKLMDGLDWVGSYDPHTPVTDLTSALALRDRFHAFGVELVPVVVPRGLAGEGEAHGALAAAFGALVDDIENGRGFWDQAPANEIPIYFKALREAAGADAQIVAQPDPRNVADVGLAQCVPYLSGLAPQHYVGWVEVGWSDVAAEIVRYQQMAAFGLPLYPTLWGEESGNFAADFWAAVLSLGALGCCAFALGPMTAGNLADYARFRLPAPPAPPPTDPCAETQAELEALQAQMVTVTAELTATQQRITNAIAVLGGTA